MLRVESQCCERTVAGLALTLPLLVVAQPPEQADALCQAGEAVGEVPLQPAVEGLLADALDGEEQADGHDLAGSKRRWLWLGTFFMQLSTRMNKLVVISLVTMGFV